MPCLWPRPERDSARNECRAARPQLERRVDAGAQVEPCRTLRRVLRRRVVQARIEDADVDAVHDEYEKRTPRRRGYSIRAMWATRRRARTILGARSSTCSPASS